MDTQEITYDDYTDKLVEQVRRNKQDNKILEVKTEGIKTLLCIMI